MLFLAIDSVSASNLAADISASSDYLELLGDYSERGFEVRALTSWAFRSENGNHILVSGGLAEKRIDLPAKLAVLSEGEWLSGKFSLSLKKVDGKLVLYVN